MNIVKPLFPRKLFASVAGFVLIIAVSGCSLFDRQETVELKFDAAATLKVGELQTGNRRVCEEKEGQEKEGQEKEGQEQEGQEQEGQEQVVPKIADVVVSWLVTEIDRQLQKRLEEYSSTYSASITVTDFYDELTPGKPTTLNYDCLEFSATENDGKLITLIVMMKVDANYLKIQPWSLLYSKAKAKSDDGQYRVASSIRMNATWFERNRGKRETVLDQIFFKHKLEPNKEVDMTKHAVLTLPLPPWSISCCDKESNPVINISVSVVELGTTNKMIEIIAKLFQSNAKDIAKLLKGALDAE